MFCPLLQLKPSETLSRFSCAAIQSETYEDVKFSELQIKSAQQSASGLVLALP